MAAAGQSARRSHSPARLPPPVNTACTDRSYEFLVGRLIDAPTLQRATVIAADWGSPVHEVLVMLGWISEADYVKILAALLRVPIVGRQRYAPVEAAGALLVQPSQLSVVASDRTPVTAVRPMAFSPPELWRFVAAHTRTGRRVVFATSAELESIFLSHNHARDRLIQNAVHGLLRLTPELSASQPDARWQHGALLILVACVSAAFVLDWKAAVTTSITILTVPFFLVAVLRCLALRELLRSTERKKPPAMRLPDRDLPVYSVLVPLYDEVDVLPNLVQALAALDYPATRLEVLLLFEEEDRKTRHAASELELPGNFRIVVVPRGTPRTKPRALNYALGLVRGSYVVVYDAEDRPEPSQLRDALERFRDGNPDLACVQARLNTYNPQASFYTRQFTLEYSVLFDGILPALERMRLPLPLGGTSNHFPVALLRRVGGWDPFNVTEDADLGIRLARLGYRTGTLRSTTWEEAPVRWRNWRGQRTRWLKGWTQTYLVHMRRPFRTARELGLRGFLGLQMLMGAILVAVLAHPLIYILLIAALIAPDNEAVQVETTLQRGLWWLAIGNTAVGFGLAIGVAIVAAIKRGRANLAGWAFLMPLYWLLIAFAGYAALIQLVSRPFYWQKTSHGSGQ